MPLCTYVHCFSNRPWPWPGSQPACPSQLQSQAQTPPLSGVRGAVHPGPRESPTAPRGMQGGPPHTRCTWSQVGEVCGTTEPLTLMAPVLPVLCKQLLVEGAVYNLIDSSMLVLM
jgi:hypothetical protein